MMLSGALGLALALAGATSTAALADEETHIHISLKDHHFDPATPTVAAGKPVMIEVSNLDPTPAEFESKSLRVEKVVAGGGTITVRVRALPAGRYRFFDDYHEATTVGFLVAK
jgi:plastocyanin